jgi:hypothetical protein
MPNKGKRILIFPIIPASPDPGSLRSTRGKRTSRPGFTHFLKTHPEMVRNHPVPVLLESFQCVLRYFDGKAGHDRGLLQEAGRTLLAANLWSWDLDTILRKILQYLKESGGSARTELDTLKEELLARCLPILTGARIFSSVLLETVVDQIIEEFESGGNQTSIEEITGRVQQNTLLRRLPAEMIDKCVDEFFVILFSRGLISFVED